MDKDLNFLQYMINVLNCLEQFCIQSSEFGTAVNVLERTSHSFVKPAFNPTGINKAPVNYFVDSLSFSLSYLFLYRSYRLCCNDELFYHIFFCPSEVKIVGATRE